MELIQGMMFLSGKFAFTVFSVLLFPYAMYLGFRSKWNLSIIARELLILIFSFTIISGLFLSVGSYGHEEEAEQWEKEVEAMKK
jgi:hypothetical protein